MHQCYLSGAVVSAERTRPTRLASVYGVWFVLVLTASSDYHWQELWRALILLLDFLASKLDSLTTTGGVEQLTQEV